MINWFMYYWGIWHRYRDIIPVFYTLNISCGWIHILVLFESSTIIATICQGKSSLYLVSEFKFYSNTADVPLTSFINTLSYLLKVNCSTSELTLYTSCYSVHTYSVLHLLHFCRQCRKSCLLQPPASTLY